MEYSLHTELVNNNVSKSNAENFCKILSGLSIGPGELRKDGISIDYQSPEVYDEFDVSRTSCWLSEDNGVCLIGGYHFGKGFYNTTFFLESTGDYTICIYDKKNRDFFDKSYELNIVTNHSNVFEENELEGTNKPSRCYHFSKESVDKLKELTFGTDDFFGDLDAIDIELFAKYGLRPDSIVLLPENVDPYAYVGNFVADKDLEISREHVRR